MRFFQDIKDKVLTQSLPGKYKSNVSFKPLLFFATLGMLNLALGIIAIILYTQIFDIKIPYSDNANRIDFTIPKDIESLNFYIEVSNFYQSHSYYASSYSISQLQGKATTDIDSCSPLKFADGKIIYPCGLMSNAYNRDQFRLFSGDTEIPIETDDIAWSSVKARVKNTTYDLDQIVAPPLWEPYTSVPELANDQRFSNWMQQSSFASFRKLYGKVQGLNAGQYTLFINKTSIFGDTKVYFSERSWLGSKNYFLGILMIVLGLFLLSMCSFIYSHQLLFS